MTEFSVMNEAEQWRVALHQIRAFDWGESVKNAIKEDGMEAVLVGVRDPDQAPTIKPAYYAVYVAVDKSKVQEWNRTAAHG